MIGALWAGLTALHHGGDVFQGATRAGTDAQIAALNQTMLAITAMIALGLVIQIAAFIRKH